MNELDEFFLHAYECSTLYKENINLYHDKRIEKNVFNHLEFGKNKVFFFYFSNIHVEVRFSIVPN